MFSHQKDTFSVFSQKYSYRQQGVDKHYCQYYNYKTENIFEIYFRIIIWPEIYNHNGQSLHNQMLIFTYTGMLRLNSEKFQIFNF